MNTTSEPKPAPSYDDVYAEFDSLCGLIRHMANTEGQCGDQDLSRCLYSIERLADRCLENFFAAMNSKGDAP